MRIIERLIDRLSQERSDITRAWSGDQYLTRWTLLGKRFGGGPAWLRDRAVFLHHFHRSDADEMHDHPWPFVSVILAGGYWEVTPAPGWSNGVGPTRRRWYSPGRVLVRPANWIHSVQLPPGRKAWTLILRGPKQRSWGFWCPTGYTPWRDHMARMQATGNGCGEG